MFLALSFVLMVPAAYLTATGKVSPLWLVGLFFLQSVGELFLSPVGLSTMTKLAPARLTGLVLGIWFLAAAFGNKLAGIMGRNFDATSPDALAQFFTEQALLVLVCACVLFALSPWVKKVNGTYSLTISALFHHGVLLVDGFVTLAIHTVFLGPKLLLLRNKPPSPLNLFWWHCDTLHVIALALLEPREMKNRLKLFQLPFLAAALMAASTPHAYAASGDTIGEAIEVINLVTADYSRDTRTLQPGDDVRQDEKIAVGSDGRSELQFADQTKIALGPGSEMLLDKFVYDSDKNSGSIVMDLVSGTLRFITGVAQKPTYVIRTPNASITVRGTIFDVYTPPKGGPTYLLLHEGGVSVCNKKGSCRNNNKPGQLVRVSKKGKI